MLGEKLAQKNLAIQYDVWTANLLFYMFTNNYPLASIFTLNAFHYASSIAFPISWRIYLLSNCTQSVAL